MKTYQKISVMAFLAILLFGCEANSVNSPEENAEQAALINAVSTTRLDATLAATTDSLCLLTNTQLAPLTESEINSILYMREEEKLANNVYVYFNEKFARPVFSNISKSEIAHGKAIAWLINLYKIETPAETVPGVFNIEELQNLYTKLTTEALTVVDAYKAGAFIEEHDIIDLQREIAETENPFIKRIYGNLLRASQFHLKAFVANLKFNGIAYQPQLLSNDDFNAIINT